MKITVKVVGEVLFSLLCAKDRSSKLILPRSCLEEKIDWTFEQLCSIGTLEDFSCDPGRVSVLLLDASNVAQFQTLRLVHRRSQGAIAGTSHEGVLSPVILVFQSFNAINVQQVPECVSDWTVVPLLTSELGSRIVWALRRMRIWQRCLEFADLKLTQEACVLSYEDRVVDLAPSECALMALLMRRRGGVVSTHALIHFFKSSGRSIELNNIRVAIFQVRLKLAILTKSNIELVNVYRHGYCLRCRDRGAAAK